MWGTGTGIRSLPTVSKYIDTSTCIGCKACEAACQEWNDLKRVPTSQTGTYQTLPELDAEFWNLIKFKERDTADGLSWLMRKDQGMHCAEPGCLAACPAPGAIVQYANGIVDVNPEACIGCGYCATGCPFEVPKFHSKTGKMAKCTLCVDRTEVGLEPACVKACPTGCLHYGTKDDMLALAALRVSQLKSNGFTKAAVYDPQGVGGTSVVTVLALLTGLPIWTPLFVWTSYLFGGLSVCRVLHPYFGIAFFVAVGVMFFDWLSDMGMSKEERSWIGPRLMKRMEEHQEETGKYNA